MAEEDFLDDLVEPEEAPADELVAPEEPPADPPAEDPEVVFADKQPDKGWVEINALHEARQQNRELMDQMQAQSGRLEALEGLKEEVMALRKPPEEEAPTPEFLDDPKGYVDAKLKGSEEALRAKYEEVSTASENSMATAQQARFAQAVTGDEQSFLREHSDYYDALNYTREIRKAEFLDLGLSEGDAQQAINNEEVALAGAALQRGKSPAGIAYSRATRWGYSAEKGDEPVGDETPTDEERLEKAEQAQSMGGSGSPNVDALLDAAEGGEDEFDQAWKDLGFGKMN